MRDYPLSLHAEDAKAQLKAMGRPVPDADAVAEARMKFELQNRPKRGLLSKALAPFSDRPDTSNAAKSGNPSMANFAPSMPLDVPEIARGGAGSTTNEVTIGAVANRDVLDKAPDARVTAGATPTPAAGDASTDKSATDKSATDKRRAPAATNATTPAATAVGETTPEANVAATAGNVTAKSAKKGKAPKQVVVKRRPNRREGEEGHRAATCACSDHSARRPGATAGQDQQRRRWAASSATMSRILLVDDSPHAQRMGERILSDEGLRSRHRQQRRFGADPPG